MMTRSLPQMEKDMGTKRTKDANIIHIDNIYANTNLDILSHYTQRHRAWGDRKI